MSPLPEGLHQFDLLTTLSLPPSTSHNASFFDKFKHPAYRLSTAFRLCDSSSPAQSHSHPKRSEIIRKHRGNYRKYTVAEKEEAVKQVHLPLYRFLKESTPRKFLRNTASLGVTCYAGRKTGVRGRREAVGPLTEKWNSPSTQKSTTKSC